MTAAFLAALVGAVAVQAATDPLPNPGFEDNLNAWEVKDTMSQAAADAAHEGTLGLRVTDEDTVGGSSVMSAKLPVKAGQEIRTTFWARTSRNFSGVYLWFFDAKGRLLKDPALKTSGGQPTAAINQTDGQWHDYAITAKAPADAAAVAIWIHSYSTTTGTADFDDFTLGVIQGHPMMWGAPGRFEEFVKIVDFLITQRAVFVTPTAYATERRSQVGSK